jgi:hypothetical protein
MKFSGPVLEINSVEYWKKKCDEALMVMITLWAMDSY